MTAPQSTPLMSGVGTSAASVGSTSVAFASVELASVELASAAFASPSGVATAGEACGPGVAVDCTPLALALAISTKRPLGT